MKQPELKRAPNGELMIKRFSTGRRLEHVFGFVVFTTLVVTGLPQKFDTSDFGAWIISALGGLENTRFLHRVAGIAFTIHAVVHIAIAVIGVATRRMRAEMLPVPQDLKDAYQNLRYFFGYAKKPPKLPKYDYRQKFEYVGMILGGLIMVFSGLVLMYPVEVAQWIPGVAIPAAVVMHSSEAVLALLVLIVWHIYTVVLSPDVFPIDESMFTGYQPVRELKHHHRREYDRLFPNGVPEIDEEDAHPETPTEVPVQPPVRRASTGDASS